MTIDRKQILDNFLETIWTISNKDYQRRVWIKGIGPECNSYDDAFNEFSSTGDAIIEEYKDFGITEEQLSALVQFRNVVSDFPDTYVLPQDFIDSPEWEKVTEAAKKILRLFNYNREESTYFAEKKDFIFNQFFYVIHNISDIEYQKRVWIDGEGPEIDTFDETIRGFFDYGRMIFGAYKAYGISENQLRHLIKFANAFEAFINKNRLPQDFINSSEWQLIVQMALAIINVFNFQKKPSTAKIKYTIRQLLSAISSVSQVHGKEEAWISFEEPGNDDFTEIVSHFLEIVRPVLENYKGLGLSENQYQQLEQLDGAIRGYLNRASLDAWVIEFLRMPDWEEIREMAKEVLFAFNYTARGQVL